jgi:histidinol phosphatase-like PHP family hydrolase
MTHELKIYPWYYCAMATQKKKFELRENDRNYQVGDILVLKEFDPATKRYTGFEMKCKVTYILTLSEFLMLDTEYVILSVTSNF